MSSDDYALALAQKYRLALSIAVINSKPENLTLTEYIDEIRRSIIDDQSDDIDIDASPCSDDFNIDYDDESTRKNVPGDIYCNNTNKVLTGTQERINDTSNVQFTGCIDRIASNVHLYVSDRGLQPNRYEYHGNHNEREENNLKTRGDVNMSQLNLCCNQNTKYVNNIKQCPEQSHEGMLDKAHSIRNGSVACVDLTLQTNRIHENNNSSQVDNKEENNGNINTFNDVRTSVVSALEESERDLNRERKETFREVIKILKGGDAATHKVNENLVQTSGTIKAFDPYDLDLTQCYDDIGDTLLGNMLANYSQDNLVNNEINNDISEKNLEFSRNTLETQPDLNTNQDRRKRRIEPNLHPTKTNEKVAKITNNIENVTTNLSNYRENNCLTITSNLDNKYVKYFGQNEVNIPPVIILENETKYASINNSIQIEDIGRTEVVDTQDTQFNTHYSESQYSYDVIIDKNLIYGNKNIQNAREEAKKQIYDKVIDNNSLDCNNSKHIIQERSETGRNIDLLSQNSIDSLKSLKETDKNTQKDFAFSQSHSMDAFPNNDMYTNTYNLMGNSLEITDTQRRIIENDKALTFDCLNNDINSDKELDNNISYSQTISLNRCVKENNIEFSPTRNIVLNEKTTNLTLQNNIISNNKIKTVHEKSDHILDNAKSNLTQDSENKNGLSENTLEKESHNDVNENACAVFDEANEDDLDEVTEKVPFKILEEMNQIKTYLSKKKEFKDSGYKSSQSQRSVISTQPASVWVGESADTVFNHLTDCPLDAATQEITEQISEVLGQLIDRLHEDEIYPKFLEDLLNTIQKLLHTVYEEENYDFDVLQKKEEQVQRIILLNKSSHIKKFTIENINNILRKCTDEIIDADNEIQHINRIENLCYMFHILQIILPKYNTSLSQVNSQSTQEPQELKLKKHDITDVWRKKWFTNRKEEAIEGSCENKCVLKDCSDVLNKIIVNLMDKYSLIAFSALKCFNLMQ